jgi:hypothetical protein
MGNSFGAGTGTRCNLEIDAFAWKCQAGKTRNAPHKAVSDQLCVEENRRFFRWNLRSAKKRQRLKVLIYLELSSEVSPYPRATASPLSREERALWRARLEGWPRGPWFVSP